MKSFADLKRNQDAVFSSVQSNIKKEGQIAEDPRFWKLTVGKDGNGTALIRFLPNPPGDGEDTPYVMYFNHWFKGPTGQWYVENCRTTLGMDDPCNDYNNKLWALDTKAAKGQASNQKRNKVYVSNILIVDDPANKENNGQVKLFTYGPMIFEKIKNKMTPQFDDQEPMDPFNPWAGANFRYRVRKDKESEYSKPDLSEFDLASALGTDEEIEEIWNKEYPLQPFLAPDQFKSYEVLKARLDTVLGLNTSSNVTRAQEIPEASPSQHRSETPAERPSAETIQPAEDDDDENLEYFTRLAQGDD